MSGIVEKIVKPTVEILEHVGRRIPQALAKAHFRVGQMAHDAADHFDKAEEDLARDAETGLARDTERGFAGAAAHGASSTAVNAVEKTAAGDGEAAAERAASHAEGDLRPHDPTQAAVPSQERRCETDPVDVATGEMVLPQVDVTLAGALPLVLERIHLSSYRHGGWFGPSWASTLDQRLQLDADGVVFATADGMRLEYPPPRAGVEVVPRKGPSLPLTWSGVPNHPMTVSDPKNGVTMVFDHPRPAPGATGGVVLRLVTIKDTNGRSIHITYGDGDSPTLITHHGGYRIAIDHHPDLPRIAGLRLLDAEGPGRDATLVRYSYDAAGNLAEVYNSSGVPLCFTYDDQHRITGWIDRKGTEYGYCYDGAGRVVRTTGSDGCMSSSFTYDEQTRTTAFTNSLGHTTTYQHNNAYRLVRTTDPLGNVTVQEWDPDNRNIVTVTDPLGRTTRSTYDHTGNLTTIEHPDSSRTKIAYNERHLPVEVVDAGGRVWRNTYDERGNRLAAVDPMGARTTYGYNEAGFLTEVTNPLGGRHQVVANPAGLPIAVTDPLGHTTTAKRDAFGRLVEATDALGNTVRIGWTIEGKVAWRERADGARQSWEYDPEGNPLTYTDAEGHTTTYAATHFDRPAGSTTADGVTYALSYDTELRLTTVTNAEGLTWQYEYDPAGRLVCETDFNHRTVHYGYDAAGQLASRTNGAGETITFTRDLLGRLVEYRAGDDITAFAYDRSGNLHRATNGHAEITREYDTAGRLLAESVNGRQTSYEYDPMGRLAERRTPSGVVSAWAYNAAGLPRTLSLAGHETTFAFDAIGRETTRHFGADITVSQTWDRIGRMAGQAITRGPEAALLQQRDYGYRADGFLTEIRELTTGSRGFNLDATGRVTAVRAPGWTETYAYDALGNLTEAATPLTASEDSTRDLWGTRLRRAGRTSYEYDAQGRVTRATKRLLNGQTRTRTFAWNALDQLTELVTADGVRWCYRYDPAGRRVAKERVGTDGATVEKIIFTWSGTRLAEQITSEGTSTTWEYSPGSHRPVAQVDCHLSQAEVDARFHAIVTDLIGTPTELLSPGGELVWQQRTTLWGIPATDPDPGIVDCPLRFPGQYYDPESGLHYNFHRYYEPETARYLSPDPLGLAPADNPTTYVRNPHRLIDPLGLAPGCGDDVVTVYRKQTDHPLSQRVHIGENGEVTITGSGKLYLNMSGDLRHTTEFRADDGGQIVAFDVPQEYRDSIRADALPQNKDDHPDGDAFTRDEWKQLLKEYPEISDPTKGSDLYGIPAKLLGGLRGAIIPKSGRVVQEG